MGCLNNEYSLLWVTKAEESKAKRKKERKNPGAVLRESRNRLRWSEE